MVSPPAGAGAPARWGRRRRRHPARVPFIAALTAATALSLSVPVAGPLARTEQAVAAAPADTGGCTFPAEPIVERPWSLQRLQPEQLWRDTRGEGVRVAVVDTGTDTANPQLADAVDVASGADFTPAEPDGEPPTESRGDGTDDAEGHGTMVAGIIAARPHEDSGFTGLAPEATIIPIRQNDAAGSGTVASLATAVDHAVAADADLINISQDSDEALTEDSDLKRAVDDALAAGVLVIAAVGNDGDDGERRETYPAAYPGVLAVAASDRDNQRAPFSQTGDFVGIAAPGVDMVSTVPGGGQCVDHGTSFATPYVTGAAALLRAAHPDWTPQQIATRLQQTAERPATGPDPDLGWGVVDPVRAVSDTTQPADEPTPDTGPAAPPGPDVPPLTSGETYAERSERLGTYALLTGLLLTAGLGGGAVVLRDRRAARVARTAGSGGAARGQASREPSRPPESDAPFAG